MALHFPRKLRSHVMIIAIGIPDFNILGIGSLRDLGIGSENYFLLAFLLGSTKVLIDRPLGHRVIGRAEGSVEFALVVSGFHVVMESCCTLLVQRVAIYP